MKSLLMTSTFGVLFAAMVAGPSCAPADSTGTGSGGRKGGTGGKGSGGSDVSGSGGSDVSGSGGSDVSGTGGSDVSGTGGSDVSGTGGSDVSGTGGSGSGGSDGTGGRGSGGSTGGAGATGSGGRGTGGSGSGSGGSGSGGAGTGTGGGSGDLTSIMGAFDGYLFTAPCGDGGTGYDCLNTGCTNGSPKTTMMDFPIGGTMGQLYDVTINVKGIVEAKNYSGCTRHPEYRMTYSTSGTNLWCEGGTYDMNNTYNTYEINVFDQRTGGTPRQGGYRLNSRDGSGDSHQSWVLNYNVTFKVMGGGRIQWRVFDRNCRQIMNCGPGAGSSTCKAPTSLPLSGAMPPAPTTFTQPFRGTGSTANAYGQWVFIDVTKVVAAQ